MSKGTLHAYKRGTRIRRWMKTERQTLRKKKSYHYHELTYRRSVFSTVEQSLLSSSHNLQSFTSEEYPRGHFYLFTYTFQQFHKQKKMRVTGNRSVNYMGCEMQMCQCKVVNTVNVVNNLFHTKQNYKSEAVGQSRI